VRIELSAFIGVCVDYTDANVARLWRWRLDTGGGRGGTGGIVGGDGGKE